MCTMCVGILRGQKRTSELQKLSSWRRLWPSHNIVLGSSPDSLQDGLVTLAIKPAPAPQLDLTIPPLSAAHSLVTTPPFPGGHNPHSLVTTPPFQTFEFRFGFLQHFQSLGNLVCCSCVSVSSTLQPASLTVSRSHRHVPSVLRRI